VNVVSREWLFSGLAAMSDAEQPTPELYREAAERVRNLAQQARLPADIRADLLDLAARFERMAAYLEARCRSNPSTDP
jgi:hypothetical protein